MTVQPRFGYARRCVALSDTSNAAHRNARASDCLWSACRAAILRSLLVRSKRSRLRPSFSSQARAFSPSADVDQPFGDVRRVHVLSLTQPNRFDVGVHVMFGIGDIGKVGCDPRTRPANQPIPSLPFPVAAVIARCPP